MPPGQGTVQVSSGMMAFQSCSAATFIYNFTGGTSIGQSGTIALGRVGPVPLAALNNANLDDYALVLGAI